LAATLSGGLDVHPISIFSELTFLVDGWTWSVDQVPNSMKVAALATVNMYSASPAGAIAASITGG
jgi:hypothetical protein